MRKDGITKVNLQLFLHHQETPQNSISTAVLIFQVGIVVACMHMRITGAFCESGEANAAFCAKRKMRGGEKFLLPSIRDSYSSRASNCCVHLAWLVKRLLCRLVLSQVAQARNMGIDLVA